MIIFIGPITAVVVFPLLIAVPMFWALKKTLLKGDNPQTNPGMTPRRLLAFLVLFISYMVPCAILYHYWVTPIFW